MGYITDNLVDVNTTPEELERIKTYEKELLSSFDKAKVDFLFDDKSLFIATFFSRLDFIFSTEVDTAATNGLAVLVNPDFFLSLEPKVRVFVFAHETWHVVLDHLNRMSDDAVDKQLYNRAADYVINYFLSKNPAMKLWDKCLFDEKYADMSAEEIYSALKNDQKNQQQSPAPDFGLSGDMQPSTTPQNKKMQRNNPNPQPLTKDELSSEIDRKLIETAVSSEMLQKDFSENLMEEMKRKLHKLRNPKLDWRTLLANYMSSFTKDDYSWSRPNKRFAPEFFLPSPYSESLGEIAFAVDTSGSVTEEEFAAYMAEIKSIKTSLNAETIKIIDFTTKINTIHEINKDSSWPDDISFKGYGGTCLAPIFEYYDKEEPTVLVIFSDLICAPMEKDPGYPVLWVCVNNEDAEVNFGELIHFKI